MVGVSRPRTLFVTLDSPFPPKRGAPLRNWRNVMLASRLGPVALFSIGENAHIGATLPGLEMWQHISASVAGAQQSRKTSAWMKAANLPLRFFRPPEYPSFDRSVTKEANEQLGSLIGRFAPTVAIVEHWVGATLPAPLARAPFPVVVDSHNVEWKLHRDFTEENAPVLTRIRADLRAFCLRSWEARLYREADRVWTVSDLDREAIQRFTGLRLQVRTLPQVVDIEYYDAVKRQKTEVSRGRRGNGPTIFYVGSLSFHPNETAGKILIDEIYPRLRETYPAAKLLLVGRHPPREMVAAARADDHIVVTGEVDDVRPYLEAADFLVVPLRVGGGARVKILEAFAAGIPVVSTTKGAEGHDIADGRELLLRDDTNAIVAGITELWEDPLRSRRIVDSAFAWVVAQYSMDAMEGRLRSEIDELTRETT